MTTKRFLGGCRGTISGQWTLHYSIIREWPCTQEEHPRVAQTALHETLRMAPSRAVI